MNWRDSPFHLKITAWLFIFLGGIFAADTLVRLVQGEVYLQIQVLGLFIGIGLLRRRRIWRYVALATLGLAMGGLLIIVVLMFLSPPKTVVFSFTLYGRRIEPSQVASAIILLAGFTLVMWEFWVLRQPGVRRLFYG